MERRVFLLCGVGALLAALGGCAPSNEGPDPENIPDQSGTEVEYTITETSVRKSHDEPCLLVTSVSKNVSDHEAIAHFSPDSPSFAAHQDGVKLDSAVVVGDSVLNASSVTLKPGAEAQGYTAFIIRDQSVPVYIEGTSDAYRLANPHTVELV